MKEVKEQVRSFVQKTFLPKGPAVRDDESLFDSGIIDSLGMIKLTAFIEASFQVVIDPAEVTMENFNTVEKIAKVILKKAGK